MRRRKRRESPQARRADTRSSTRARSAESRAVTGSSSRWLREPVPRRPALRRVHSHREGGANSRGHASATPVTNLKGTRWGMSAVGAIPHASDTTRFRPAERLAKASGPAHEVGVLQPSLSPRHKLPLWTQRPEASWPTNRSGGRQCLQPRVDLVPQWFLKRKLTDPPGVKKRRTPALSLLTRWPLAFTRASRARDSKARLSLLRRR